MILTSLIQFIVAACATIGFAILFNAPKKELPYCGLTGGIGWLVYFALIHHANANIITANLFACFVLTIFARSFAAGRSNPVTVYLMAGIFPLVPGAGIYYSAYNLISGDRAAFAAKATETLEIALAIVFGIIFGTAIPQIIFNKLFGRKH